MKRVVTFNVVTPNVLALKKHLAVWVLGFAALGLAACDGDVRPFLEQVETDDLDLQALTIVAPSNALSPLFVSPGQGLTLTVAGTNTNGQSVSLSPYNRRWTSSDSRVLSITDDGYVRALTNGTSSISVQVGDVVATEPLSITVSDAPLLGIDSITGSSDTTGMPAERLDPCIAVTYSAVGDYGGNDKRALQNIAWSIDDEALANDAELFRTSVTPVGSIRLVGRQPFNADDVGAITLSARVLNDDGETDERFNVFERTLTVSDSLTDLAVQPATLSLLTGQTFQINAVATYSTTDNGVATGGVRWSVLNGAASLSVGTVASRPGVLTGRAVGEATVRASCGAFSAESVVTVVNSGNLLFNRTSDIILELDDGDFTDLKVFIGDVSVAANERTNVATWASSDESVATVDTSGNVRGHITPVGVGTTEITAEYEGSRVGITVEVR